MARSPIPTSEVDERLETTAELLARIRAGDHRAQNKLLSRYVPNLSRWAHGRLPVSARDLVDTKDLVQNTLVRALSHLDSFQPRREGAFVAYLRKILLNQIRDQARRAARRPELEVLGEELKRHVPSPLEETIGREMVDAYEEGLTRLSAEHREAVVMRIELGFTYREVAEALLYPSANAARMAVTRALVKLAEHMQEYREP